MTPRTDYGRWTGDPHPGPFHLTGYVAVGGGFWLLSASWNVLHTTVQRGELATTGPYARVRHPQVRRPDANHDRVPAVTAYHPRRRRHARARLGPWGAVTIAAALVHAAADTRRGLKQEPDG